MPLEGLAPIIVEELARAIKRMVSEQGVAMILVEQHAIVALSLTHNAVVVERGKIIHRGSSAELLGDLDKLQRLIGVQVAGRE